MNTKDYVDDFIINAEETDWEDRESNDEEENLEEVTYQSQSKKTNMEEFIEAIPYLLAIIIFCMVIFYLCK